MAKALARFYSTSKRLKTYNLGNCVEPHSVATIIGVPPGYVGNDQGGRLINELNAERLIGLRVGRGWDPDLRCWYYWYRAGNCYDPVSYCP